MKKIILSLLFVFGIVHMYSQVSVTGSNGADGSYSNLKAAFDAINLQSNQSDKNIVITLSGSTTETASAVLNQPADTSWTSLIIYPTTSGVSISGNIDGSPLIDLNGADKVTIDGRVNATDSTKDLMISNTSTSNLANTSTIRFINDATNNTVQFCTVSGSETNTSSGVIMFSTASVTGNDDNSIINNNLTHAGVNSNRPINIILSIGAATFTNSGILISNNNIYDFLKHATTSNGVYLKDNTTECTVSNNSFYETSAFTAITADANYRIIQINNGFGNKFNVIGNYIGGQSPFCGGSSWIKTARNGTFAAIYINVGGLVGNETTISGNTIANFSWTNSGAANWRGMELNAGKIFLGSSGNQNTIGSQTLPISVTAGASGANTQGIYINSATVDGAYNSVRYIASNATNAAHANNLYGIYKNAAGGALTLDNCNISNLTANSPSSANTQILQGIFSAYSGTTTVNITNCTIRSLTNNTTNSAGYVQGIRLDHGSNTVTGNSIYDLNIANPSTSVTETCSAAGIVVYYTTPGTIRNQTISQNTIYNISNTRTNTDFTGMVVGIYYAPNAGNHIVSRNFIHDLSVNATPVNAILSAIYFGTGGGNATNASTSVLSNNLMSIAGNTSTTIYGIYEVGAQYHNVNLFYNTVYISGSLGAGIINPSYCLYSAAQNNTRDFRNNLFFNARSTIGGGSLHYASYYNYADNTNLTNDYNDYFVSGIGGVLGFFNGIDKTDVNITGIEINSKNLDPVFLLAGSSLATDYLPTVTTLNTGASLSVTTDYFGATRANKTIGALEVLVPVVEVWQSGVKLAEYTSLKNAFDKFNDGTHYAGSFEIKITGNVIETTSAVLNASSGSVNYDHISIYPTGTYSISGSIAGPLIDLNGSDSVVIDGRINAMGSSKDLTIINTSTSPVAGTSTLRLINDACSNMIQFCVLKGSQTCSTSGIVFISTSNMISGNDNNIIDNNQITCASDVNRPLNAIYSSGTLVKENNGLIIRNNNIYNFLSRSSASNGINIFEYTTNSTISGNSFFETASFAPIASVEYAIIRVNNTAGNDFEIANNYIGGDAAFCSGVWTKTNAFNNTFYGIYMSVDSIIASKVDGNIIKNLNYSNSLNANWYGLYFNSGSFNIGSIKGNIIGDSVGTGSIVFTNSTTVGTFCAIYLASTSTINCENNVISSIQVANNLSTAATHFYGIYKVNTDSINIKNNKIGSETTNSIQCLSLSSSSAQYLVGINILGSGQTIIDSNIIRNLKNNVSGSMSSQTVAIQSLAGNNVILNNRINNISTASGQTGKGLSASAAGIMQTSNGSNTKQIIKANSVQNIVNTHASARVDIYGIFNQSSNDVENEIIGNFINGFSISSSAIASDFDGMVLYDGMVKCANNIISLGDNVSNGYRIYGIFHSLGVAKINFNSLVISGTVTSPTCYNAIPLYSATTTERDFRNNILVNNRSGGTPFGTEGYRLIRLQDAGANLNLDYNDYFTSSGAVFRINNSNYSDFTSFSIASGKDVNSLNVDPQFLNNISTNWRDYYPLNDLQGISIVSITDDYYSIARELPMIGALEGNVWEGFYSNDFGTGSNWLSNRVPQSGKSIRFAKMPYNHCVLDQNRIINHMYNEQSSFDFVVNGKKITIQGVLNLLNGAQINAKNIGSDVEFNGAIAQIIPANSFVDDITEKLTINNDFGVTISNDLLVNNTLTFLLGRVNTGSNSIIMTESANTVVGADETKYINGICSKIGNSSFVFPVGKGNVYAPIGISAPLLATDQFTAEYFNIQPTDKNNLAPTLHHISDCEYWNLSRTNGNSNVSVILSWGSRSCGVSLLSDLKVAHYIGGRWEDEGNSSTTGDVNSGTITSNIVNNFSPFTLSSKSNQNILPVSIINNEVDCLVNGVEVKWVTASERNSAYFEIQSSNDLYIWNSVGKVVASGNSNVIRNYNYFLGENQTDKYYRLRMIDLNSELAFSSVMVNSCLNIESEWSAYPNPFNDVIYVNIPVYYIGNHFNLLNNDGAIIKKGKIMSSCVEISTDDIAPGDYFIQLENSENIIKLIKHK